MNRTFFEGLHENLKKSDWQRVGHDLHRPLGHHPLSDLVFSLDSRHQSDCRTGGGESHMNLSTIQKWDIHG
jgi:hypothetical protein